MMHEYATQESVNLSPRPDNPMATTLFRDSSTSSSSSSPLNYLCNNNNDGTGGFSLEYSGTSATEHLTLSVDYDGDEEDNTTLGSTPLDDHRLGIADMELSPRRRGLLSPFPQSGSLHNHSTADYHTIVLTPPAPPKSVLVAPPKSITTTNGGIDISPIATKHYDEGKCAAVLPTLPDLGQRMNRLGISFPEDRWYGSTIQPPLMQNNNKTVSFAPPKGDPSIQPIPSMITTTAMTPTTSPMAASMMTPFQHPLTRREQQQCGILTPGFYQATLFATPRSIMSDRHNNPNVNNDHGACYKQGVSVAPTPPSSPVAGAQKTPVRPVRQETALDDVVPQSWLDLYHNRPSSSADDKSRTLVWMRQVLAMRKVESEDDHDAKGAWMSPSTANRSTPNSKQFGSKRGPVDTPVLKALLK